MQSSAAGRNILDAHRAMGKDGAVVSGKSNSWGCVLVDVETKASRNRQRVAVDARDPGEIRATD